MVLPPIVVDRRFHIFMNSIPYPKGSLNVLIAHFGTFSCKCGIRTEINSLFNKRGSKRRKSNSHSRREFLRFFTPIFKISCSRIWKNTLARRCRQQREKCKAAVERVRGSLRANQQRERRPSSLRNAFLCFRRQPVSMTPAFKSRFTSNATFVVDILSQKIHQRFVIQGDEILTQIHWYCAGTTVTFLGMAP